MKILVTGSSGYIGRQIAQRLVVDGHEVTCMVRDASRANLGIAARCRVVEADVLQPEALAPALERIEVAYYLIHSMSGQERGFEVAIVVVLTISRSQQKTLGCGE